MGVYLGVFYEAQTPVQVYVLFGAEFFLYSFFLTWINFEFHQQLTLKFPWKTAPKKRFFLGVVGSILLTLLVFFFLRILKFMLIDRVSLSYFFEHEQKSYYIIALFISVFTTFVFHLFYFYKALQDKKITTHKIKAGTATAQLDALKNQLDPHFLFNSLNVLTSLIEESPEKAQNFTTTLSRVYRYVLDKKHENLVPLAEELIFAHSYMQLLKMRFEEGLKYTIPETPSQNGFKVAPLSLQLLLENAIKHNRATTASPLEIKVYEKAGYVVIENNKQLKKTLHSSGLGLQNIINRYSAISELEVRISETDTHFIVQIPIITHSKIIMKNTDQILDEKRYQKAKSKVKNIIGFYYHLFVYVIVISFLAWLNYQTTNFPWVLFPTFGWGIGLTSHGLQAFDKSLFFGKDWEERQINALLEKESKAKSKTS